MTQGNLKPYKQVNREERLYCMLLAHCLLGSGAARNGFSDAVQRHADLPGALSEPSDLEVYVEVAALRDYWRSLGNPKAYSAETEGNRLAFLRNALEWANRLEPRGEKGWSRIPDELLKKTPDSPFWTTGKDSEYTRKLWSPARWPISRLEEFPASSACVERLKRLRWAFNAKPDILVLAGQSGLLIEAKVESGGGSNKDGYTQLQTQKDIISLWKHLDLPGLNGNICLVTLGKGGKPSDSTHHLTWKQIIEGMGVEHMDPFTQECFESFRR